MIFSVKVIKENFFNVYVYPEDHAPPHCHIRYKGHEAESIVGLPLLNLLAGPVLEKQIKKVLQNNLARLTQKWEELNPTTIKQIEKKL